MLFPLILFPCIMKNSYLTSHYLPKDAISFKPLNYGTIVLEELKHEFNY